MMPRMGGRDVSEVSSDADWDSARRDETETERLDRNWSDLGQELRVVQTGVQVLTGFLVTLPFQQRFGQLDTDTRDVYLATLSAAVLATAALVTPVSTHRLLFRRHARASMVAVGHRCALAGLTLLGIAVCGVVDVIATLVVNDTAGAVGAGVTAVLLITAWLVVPLILRERRQPG
jgi:hypothetical protein